MSVERRTKPHVKFRIRCSFKSPGFACMNRGPWRSTYERATRDAIKKGFAYCPYSIYCPQHRKEVSHDTT